MEVVIANMIGGGIIALMIMTDAPTWGWLAMIGALVVGNIAGAFMAGK